MITGTTLTYPMYARQYRRRRLVPRRKKNPAKKLSKPMRSAVAAVAKRVISRRAEDKVCGAPVEADVLHNSAIGSADCEPVIMQIPQGVDSNKRVGDRISPRSLKVKGVISVSSDAAPLALNKDVYVRVLLLAQKDVKAGAAVLSGAIDSQALLRAGYGGTGDAIPFSGDTSDLCQPINTNLFRVYMDKQFKLDVSNLATGPSAPLSKEWSYTFTKKQLPASLYFDEGNGDWPNNFSPFLAIGYAYADGTAPDTVGTRIISNCISHLYFEDL